MTFQNNPGLKDENNEGKVKRYVHQVLTGDHYGIHFKIQANGRVQIIATTMEAGELVSDEIELPASLIFKLATLLKATREIKFVNVSEAKDLPASDKE